MSYYQTHGQSSMCTPWMTYYYPYIYMPWSYQYWPQNLCPSCRQPPNHCWCAQRQWTILPQEILVDEASSPKEIFVGGICDAKFTLEYMAVAETEEPVVRLTITSTGVTSTWEESVTEDYHVKSDLPKVSPGAKATLETTGAIARLRWCEIIEY